MSERWRVGMRLGFPQVGQLRMTENSMLVLNAIIIQRLNGSPKFAKISKRSIREFCRRFFRIAPRHLRKRAAVP